MIFLALSGPLRAQEADLIFQGGTVIPVAGAAEAPPPEAVAVRDGRIAALGSLADIEPLRGARTRVIDLEGGALLPGFIDAHGHLVSVAQLVDVANLAPPPAGGVADIAGLLATLERHRVEQDLGPRDWIVGFGYDDSLLAERRHPTRDDLDARFADNPVFLYHVSGHLAVASSKALEAAGITAETVDPAGGVFRRREGSREPNGVLEESAMYPVASRLPQPDLAQRLDQLDQAQGLYARYGITTAQDGFTNPAGLALLREAAASDRLVMDVVAFPAGRELAAFELETEDFGGYQNRLEIGGVKLMLDGSPQGKTAFLSVPYEVPPAGQGEGYRGYPAMELAEVDALFRKFLQLRVPILAHANGDAAADQLIHAIQATRREFGMAGGDLGDHRTVMIHSQVVRDDQLDRLAELGVIPSFFVAHTFYWGDWHRDSVLGPARADRISPVRSALRRGIRPTFHNDAPIVPPDMMRLIWTAVNRRTRSGDILGPGERVTVLEAIRAVTLDAAYQNFEEKEKGSIEVGKLADLVVLEANPLEVAPEDLDGIGVVETFSRGVSLYRRDL